jgi:hypothetical protein
MRLSFFVLPRRVRVSQMLSELFMAQRLGDTSGRNRRPSMAGGKDKSSSTGDPTISSIDPTSVKQNMEVPLAVYGTNFGADSFVLADDVFLQTTYISATQLKGALTKQVTGSPGRKSIKVHNTDTGGLSNEVTLTVKPATSGKDAGYPGSSS